MKNNGSEIINPGKLKKEQTDLIRRKGKKTEMTVREQQQKRRKDMDYRKTAQEIYDHVGKKENIISAAHCATRLRLVIADNDKADKEYVENIDGVKGVFFAQGQMQIILGTGVVNKVYDELAKAGYACGNCLCLPLATLSVNEITNVVKSVSGK